MWFSHPKKSSGSAVLGRIFTWVEFGHAHVHTTISTVLAHEHEGKTVRYLQPYIPFVLPCPESQKTKLDLVVHERRSCTQSLTFTVDHG